MQTWARGIWLSLWSMCWEKRISAIIMCLLFKFSSRRRVPSSGRYSNYVPWTVINSRPLILKRLGNFWPEVRSLGGSDYLNVSTYLLHFFSGIVNHSDLLRDKSFLLTVSTFLFSNKWLENPRHFVTNSGNWWQIDSSLLTTKSSLKVKHCLLRQDGWNVATQHLIFSQYSTSCVWHRKLSKIKLSEICPKLVNFRIQDSE